MHAECETRRAGVAHGSGREKRAPARRLGGAAIVRTAAARRVATHGAATEVEGAWTPGVEGPNGDGWLRWGSGNSGSSAQRRQGLFRSCCERGAGISGQCRANGICNTGMNEN
jgi:hypothetical protein